MYYICGVTNHSQNKVLMKRNLFWLFLFTCSLSWADNVPVSKAEQLARNFFGIHETTRAGDICNWSISGMVRMYKHV